VNASSSQPRRRWRRVLHLARPQWRGYVLMWVLTLASSGIVLLQPWPVQVLVDHVLAGEAAPAWLSATLVVLPGGESPVALAAWIALASLGLFVLSSVVDVALTFSWLYVAQRGVYTLASNVFARLQRRSPSFHALTPVGESIRRVTGDSWCVYNALGALVFTPLHAVAVGGLMIVVLLSMNPVLTLVAIAAAPVLAVMSLALGKRAERTKGVERQVQGQIESHLQQTLAGMRVVQTSGQGDREHNRFLALAGDAVIAHRRSAIVGALSAGSAGLATAAGTGVVLGLGAHEVLAGRLTLGQLLVFLAYLGLLNGQLVRLATAYTMLRGLAPSIDRIADVLDAQPEVADSALAAPLRVALGEAGLPLRFEGMCFEYQPGCPVLRDISLDVPAGAMLAIVGPSGSGKSTLAALLGRLMDPARGRVLLAEQDLRDVTIDSLRANVAISFQEPMLFADSIADNIALGRPDATPEQIRAAGTAAGLDPVIARLPQGYDTVLGQAGATVSGGEQQRIGIARALVMNAPVLVLDEPSSALDTQTEVRLFEALRAGPPRTTIVIAHRLSTIRQADVIAVLDGGRLVESGTHDELLERGGLYARLWRIQCGDEVLTPLQAEEPVA
jgi:ATP-binding cassette, subfamily B, bacterial